MGLAVSWCPTGPARVCYHKVDGGMTGGLVVPLGGGMARAYIPLGDGTVVPYGEPVTLPRAKRMVEGWVRRSPNTVAFHIEAKALLAARPEPSWRKKKRRRRKD